MNFKYDHLEYTIGDVLKDRSKEVQKFNPWRIKNMLPTEFHLFYNPPFTKTSVYIGVIRPQASLDFNHSKFSDGGSLSVMFKSKKKFYLAMPVHILRSNQKYIKLGDVVYRSSGGGREHFTSYADISGLMLHNELMFPLNIFFKGNLVGVIGARDGMTYLGGSAASRYIDNNRAGYRLGDKITFGYSMEGNKDTLFTITLTDNHVHHVYIGKIDAGYFQNYPDTYAYSVDYPPQTGYTYYRPIGRYNSIATNPFAPI